MMQFIPLHDDKFRTQQRFAGQVVAKCLDQFRELIKAKTPNLSLKDIEALCEQIIADNGCTATFKGYQGFPGAVCLSVNKQLVHGIPTDYVLHEGDLVTLDLGATEPEGAIGDAACTVIYGEPKSQEHVRLIHTCEKALQNAIEAIKVGNHLGCIGNAIYHTTKDSGFKIIENYGGHGLDRNMPHANPFVRNKSSKDDGVRIQPGMSIAIEPMLSMASNKTRKLKDNWTIVTSGINAHFEHTVFVREDAVEIITL